MKNKQAAKYFHGEEGLNCAQAVLKAFQPESGMTDFTIKSAQVAGGGRAKDGVCGALYAVQMVFGEGKATDDVVENFVKQNGSPLCQDIKTTECQCREYVRTATELAEKHIDMLDKENADYVFDRKIREVDMLVKPES
ncbi:C-GCAxxG-C-C family protein [Vibrio hannami]|uniref:C-GCAxxG-C-C family protein n=1 Tax=Vibrio hannami TaxID=2717094 RepID=UPI002410A8A9|nr:C-GCAxxG-C-C family protein [Vibrio hannami]MDG3087345.1 C-GCAxxG-C-C family protein [Vibrio hannami]